MQRTNFHECHIASHTANQFNKASYLYELQLRVKKGVQLNNRKKMMIDAILGIQKKLSPFQDLKFERLRSK